MQRNNNDETQRGHCETWTTIARLELGEGAYSGGGGAYTQRGAHTLRGGGGGIHSKGTFRVARELLAIIYCATQSE